MLYRVTVDDLPVHRNLDPTTGVTHRLEVTQNGHTAWFVLSPEGNNYRLLLPHHANQGAHDPMRDTGVIILPCTWLCTYHLESGAEVVWIIGAEYPTREEIPDAAT